MISHGYQGFGLSEAQSTQVRGWRSRSCGLWDAATLGDELLVGKFRALGEEGQREGVHSLVRG